MIISLIVASCFYFCFPNNDVIQEYWFNISIGIFTGCFLSFTLSIISYLGEKREALEDFHQAYLCVRDHSAKYSKNFSDQEIKKWFHEYIMYNQKLSYQWSKIGFVFDRKSARRFLKEICDFYNDFIILTKWDFWKLENKEIPQNIKDNARLKINKVVFKKEKSIIPDMPGCNAEVELNRLADFINRMNDDEYIIYSGKRTKKKKFKIEITMVDPEYFHILRYDLRKYMKYAQKSGSMIKIPNITLDEIKELMKEGYVSGYSGDNPYCVSFNYIALYYTYFSKKIRLCNNMTLEYIRDIHQNNQ